MTTETPEISTETTENAAPTVPNDGTIDTQKVLEVLQLVRPYLQSDGGDCELVGITKENAVLLRLQGACGTCPSSTYTLKMGIEEQMKQYIPEVSEVQQVM